MGFNPNHVQQGWRVGLHSMQERIGSEFNINATSEQTHIPVMIPRLICA